MVGWATLATAALAATGPLAPAAPRAEAPAPRAVPTDPARVRADAAAAEKAGQWDLALDLYLRAYAAGRSAELRDRIRHVLRNAAQLRRHRDPAFQQFVLSLPASDALNLYAEVLEKLAALHLDRDRATPSRLYALGLAELDRALADAGFRDRHLASPSDARVERFRRDLRDTFPLQKPSSAREARFAAREVVQAAQSQLGVRTPAALVFELLCGACNGLDEYTVYVTPGGPHAELAAAVAEFAEYGILVRVDGSDLVVDGVLAGSWAALRTGLRKGDRVVRVNGRALEAGNPTSLGQALRAPGMFGHELELPPTDAGMPVVLVRLPLVPPTVFGADVLKPQDGVGYVRVSSFRDTTPRELDEALFSLKARGVRAVVIDLRNNPGGSFPAAVATAQRLLPAGIVVTTQGPSSDFAGRVFSSDAGMTAFDIPVVLLIDTRTMSAAEAVAAAWKDHNRATLVGLPTFGKGVVQSPVRLTAIDGPDGAPRSGVLVLTVATMFAPRGAALNGAGVVPHVLEADPARQLALAVEKAIELAAGMR